jgi:uncharacterized protein YjiS (DUF1127 family)
MTTTALKNRFALRHATVSGTFAATWTAINLWRERARQRRGLAEMSPEMLRDIGLSYSAARAEAGKPFWVA